VRVCAAALLCAAGTAFTRAAQPDPVPSTVRQVVFLGDSITAGGWYVSTFETWYLTRHPEREVSFLNLGLGSETVSGLSEPGHAGGKFPRPDLHERLQRALAQTKPGLVFACYGMNDGIYLPFDEERFAAFQRGMTRLHNAVNAAGAEIIHVTPPVYDESRRPAPGYAAVLDRYSAWLVAQRAKGWRVLDLHTRMRQALDARRAEDPKFTYTPDGIHPNADGHWVMARALLLELGATDVTPQSTVDQVFPGPRRRELLDLVHQRQSVLKDAWVTAIGHKRPQPPGLPLPEATARAQELDTRIAALLKELKDNS
jgi:lysophospholipase L1-like esterase